MKKPTTVILLVSLVALLLGVALGHAAEVTHRLKPSPKSVTWGYFDPRTPPVLRVRSGDTVEIETLVAGGPEALEAAGLPRDQMQPALLQIDREVKERGEVRQFFTEPAGTEEAGQG